MPSLLSLPRELRDAIIDEVLQIPMIPWPQSTAAWESTPRRSGPGNIRYPVLPSHKIYAAYGLLMTNRQLHDETLERLRWTPLYSRVDVQLVNQKELWPAWTFIPCKHMPPGTVEIVFHMEDVPMDDFADHLAYHFGYASGGRADDTLFAMPYLLVHILAVVGREDMQEMVINIMPPPEIWEDEDWFYIDPSRVTTLSLTDTERGEFAVCRHRLHTTMRDIVAELADDGTARSTEYPTVVETFVKHSLRLAGRKVDGFAVHTLAWKLRNGQMIVLLDGFGWDPT